MNKQQSYKRYRVVIFVPGTQRRRRFVVQAHNQDEALSHGKVKFQERFGYWPPADWKAEVES